MKLQEKYKSLFERYGLTTPLRIAHFMAQIEHESGLKPISENLNYSAVRLLKVFPKYFKNSKEASVFSNSPIMIANRVYANRGGNGNEASGDGWRYRGRGFLQITLKENYFRLANDTDIDCLKNPDLLLEESNAMISALWFWKINKLNKYADLDDLDAVSDAINLGRQTIKEGDSNGYNHRVDCLKKWKMIMKI